MWQQPDVTVLLDQGLDGADRVVLTWPDGTIQNQWLQVRVIAEGAIGMTSDDVFYFGNVVGDTGNSLLDTLVNAADVIGVRDHPRGANHPAALTDPFDLNRDGAVDALDIVIARNNAVSPLGSLELISLPGGAPPIVSPVPEPSTGVLGGLALLALLAFRHRRRA